MPECTQVNFLRNHDSDSGRFLFAFMHGGAPPSPFPLCSVRLVSITISFYPVVLYSVLGHIAKVVEWLCYTLFTSTSFHVSRKYAPGQVKSLRTSRCPTMLFLLTWG